ncbi:MAG TPA: hypothetical protein VLC95_10680, partial [Anaerolineae bacterium]|nr:hypothetical protein [Anaerolineae bacterium]
VDSILALDPDANVVVLGDLNDFQFSAAIADVLEADALTNLIWSLAPNERYTYIYDGNSQVLDQILVSEHLWQMMPGYDIVHVNAEWPAAERPTDHDPAVAQLPLIESALALSYKTVEPMGSVAPGDLLTYTVVLSNAGSTDLSVTITDVLPADLVLVSGFEGGGLTWTGIVSAGEQVMLTLVAQVDPDLVGIVTIQNQVIVDDGVEPPFTIVSPETILQGPMFYYLPLIYKNSTTPAPGG